MFTVILIMLIIVSILAQRTLVIQLAIVEMFMHLELSIWLEWKNKLKQLKCFQPSQGRNVFQLYSYVAHMLMISLGREAASINMQI